MFILNSLTKCSLKENRILFLFNPDIYRKKFAHKTKKVKLWIFKKCFPNPDIEE